MGITRRILLVWCVLHLCLVTVISGREIIWVLARTWTIFPESSEPFWKRTDQIASGLVGEHVPISHPARQIVAGYEHLAGIEAGYGYFAPNVTNSSRLVFEIHYPDGRTELDLPSLGSHAAGIRFASLLDKIRLTEDSELRELMVKMLTYANWQEHPKATKIRALFGEVVLPNIDQFQRGEEEHFETIYTYEFVKRNDGDQKPSE